MKTDACRPRRRVDPRYFETLRIPVARQHHSRGQLTCDGSGMPSQPRGGIAIGSVLPDAQEVQALAKHDRIMLHVKRIIESDLLGKLAVAGQAGTRRL